MPPEREQRPGEDPAAVDRCQTGDSAESQPAPSPRAFLEAIHGTEPSGWIEFRLIPDPVRGAPVRRNWVKSPTEIDTLLELYWVIAERENAGVFFGVLPRREKGKGSAVDTLPSRIVWVDLDFKDYAGGETEARKRLAEFPIAPSIVVRTGHGLHAYWLLREELDPAELAALSKALVSVLGADHAFDAARLLRLPGTYNRKNPEHPILVVIESFHPQRAFNASDVRQALELVGWKPPAPTSASVGLSTPQDELQIDPVVLTVPLGDQVRMLLSADRKVGDYFMGRGKPAKTPEGKRLDDSSSGYDFSFALSLIKRGVRDPSEIAGAIAARPDGEAREKGIGYIRRTVANALAFAEREECLRGGSPASSRDFLVERVVIFTSNPPSYGFTIDGKELRLGSSDLHSERVFSLRFLEAMHRIPTLHTSKENPWPKIVNGWLAKAEHVELPPEASCEGALREAVEHAVERLSAGDESSDLERGKAVLLSDGRIAFRLATVFKAVREELPDANRQHVARVVRELGYVPGSHRVGEKVHRLWSVTHTTRAGEIADASE